MIKQSDLNFSENTKTFVIANYKKYSFYWERGMKTVIIGYLKDTVNFEQECKDNTPAAAKRAMIKFINKRGA